MLIYLQTAKPTEMASRNPRSSDTNQLLAWVYNITFLHDYEIEFDYLPVILTDFLFTTKVSLTQKISNWIFFHVLYYVCILYLILNYVLVKDYKQMLERNVLMKGTIFFWYCLNNSNYYPFWFYKFILPNKILIRP